MLSPSQYGPYAGEIYDDGNDARELPQLATARNFAIQPLRGVQACVRFKHTASSLSHRHEQTPGQEWGGQTSSMEVRRERPKLRTEHENIIQCVPRRSPYLKQIRHRKRTGTLMSKSPEGQKMGQNTRKVRKNSEMEREE